MSTDTDDVFEQKIVDAYAQLRQHPGLPQNLFERLRCVRTMLAAAPKSVISGPRLLLKEPLMWVALTPPQTVVGKADDCQVCLEQADVSKHHCCFEFRDDLWTVRDLDSKNGLFVNGIRQQQKALSDGDILQLGSATLVFFV